MKMPFIKVLCSDHFLRDLINMELSFKFSRGFNCDCNSNEKTLVMECTHENQENLKHNKNQTCLGCEKIKNLPDIHSCFFKR